MPHLSPMLWSSLPLLFMSFLILLSISFWWHQLPTLTQKKKKKNKMNVWLWNY